MREREIKFTEKEDAEQWDRSRENRRNPHRQTNTPILAVWFILFKYMVAC